MLTARLRFGKGIMAPKSAPSRARVGRGRCLAKTLFGALLRFGIAMRRSEFAKKYFENGLDSFSVGSLDRLLLVHNLSRNFWGNSCAATGATTDNISPTRRSRPCWHRRC